MLKADSLPEDVLVALDRELQEQGFSRVSNPEELLVERVKLAVFLLSISSTTFLMWTDSLVTVSKLYGAVSLHTLNSIE